MRRLSPLAHPAAIVAILLATSLGIASCGNDSSAARILRFSGIPDADKARLNANAEIIQSYLSKELGMKVQFVESASYLAACNGVASNKLDIAWLGGVTSVQAEQRSKGQVTFVACRESDLKFHSYFIANKDAIAAGKIKKVDRLENLAGMLKSCTFTFGAKSSTSGRIMPQHFLAEAGIAIDNGFQGRARFQLEGGHIATLNAVSTGTVDVGTLNYLTYDAADAETKANAPIIYKTPAYVDYCMVAHNRLGQDTIDKIRAAFTKLDADDEAHKKVLDAFTARRFVTANAGDWDGIRAVLKSTKVD